MLFYVQKFRAYPILYTLYPILCTFFHNFMLKSKTSIFGIKSKYYPIFFTTSHFIPFYINPFTSDSIRSLDWPYILNSLWWWYINWWWWHRKFFNWPAVWSWLFVKSVQFLIPRFLGVFLSANFYKIFEEVISVSSLPTTCLFHL